MSSEISIVTLQLLKRNNLLEEAILVCNDVINTNSIK